MWPHEPPHLSTRLPPTIASHCLRKGYGTSLVVYNLSPKIATGFFILYNYFSTVNYHISMFPLFFVKCEWAATLTCLSLTQKSLQINESIGFLAKRSIYNVLHKHAFGSHLMSPDACIFWNNEELFYVFIMWILA